MTSEISVVLGEASCAPPWNRRLGRDVWLRGWWLSNFLLKVQVALWMSALSWRLPADWEGATANLQTKKPA